MKTKQIPIIVSGGLDTKTNPKLVKPGAALQIDNMFQLRPGEWRARNGMTTQVASNKTVTSAPFPYATPSGGGVSAVARGLGSFVPAIPARFGTRGTGLLGWENANGTTNAQFPHPSFAASTVGLYGDGSSDVFDGDIARAGVFTGVIAASAGAKFFETSTGRVVDYSTFSPVFVTPARMTSTTNYLVAVGLTGAGPYSIQLLVYGVAGGIASYTPASLVTVVSAAQPWFDVIANPTTDTVTVAYRASAGGVSAAVVDLSTGTVTVGPSNYATADATLALTFIDSTVKFASGTVTLVAAGGTNGIVYFTINVTTLVAGGAVTVDATATANVRQLAGHWESATTVTVLWEVPGSSRIYDTVKRGRVVSGTPATFNLAPSYSLYSRTAKGADGKWHFIGTYDSPTAQGCYALLTCDDYVSSGNNRTAPMCFAFPGEGGGRRGAQSSVTNLIASGSTFTCALPRKRRVTVSGVSAAQGRVLQLVTFSDALPTASRARELGGVTYLPGGLVYADDGQSCRAAVFPRYPEVPALASFNGGGGMSSSKTYSYRLVLKRQDSAGRILRSAASVPVSITLGAGDNAVQLTIPNPYLYWVDFLAFTSVEIYRVGPVESGATLYNLVTTTALLNQNADSLTVVNDLASDATAALGEVAYFTGNVEENIAPPSCSLLEVNGGRIWIVNAEDPSELRYSKQSKAGTIPGFNTDFALRIDGDGRGGITALGSMDGRLIVFKDGAIWVVSGDGPNDLGQGSFSPPQIASRETGVPTGLARSVVSTPDGLMFQSARGIYLLDRGLGLTYIGAPVETYTLAANVVDASPVRGTTQVRFVMASGRCLVWDYQTKTWSTFILPVGGSSIVGCVDATAGWYYVTADGKLRLEVSGATTDDGAAIVPVISLPHLTFAGLSGYQRVRSLDFLFDVVGNHTFSVDAEFNYSGALTGSPKTKAMTTATPTAQVQYLPPDGLAKCTAMRPVITVTGAPVSGTFRLTSVTAVIGIKSGTNIADGNRLT